MPDKKSMNYIYGTFQMEIKNRFLCSVNIDGKDEAGISPGPSLP